MLQIILWRCLLFLLARLEPLHPPGLGATRSVLPSDIPGESSLKTRVLTHRLGAMKRWTRCHQPLTILPTTYQPLLHLKTLFPRTSMISKISQKRIRQTHCQLIIGILAVPDLGRSSIVGTEFYSMILILAPKIRHGKGHYLCASYSSIVCIPI